MTSGLCLCGHMWSNHRKIEGCLGDPDPNRPYKYEKRCACIRFRQKVEGKMINRDQWAELYDWARHNGLSPVEFVLQAMENQRIASFQIIGMRNLTDEEAIYEACRKFSISRTEYPSASE